jgi:1,4-alpha-glucan branching enzyme
MHLEATDQQFLRPDDLHLFNEGTQLRLYEKLGAHLLHDGRRAGAHFAVWAPHAEHLSVIGDFNDWDKEASQLTIQGSSGLWAGFVPNVRESALYKYHIEAQGGKFAVNKPDPVGFYYEAAPNSASLVWDLGYEWHDQTWMGERPQRNTMERPMSIYEVHLGSWRRVPEEGNRFLTYRETAPLLANYVQKHGFTHVEFLPLMEHPFYGSWGYQTTGYFAPTSRYGRPQELMFLIDYLHQQGIGVILDWVPSHFPNDEQGLACFDGTALYEQHDPRQRSHSEWNSHLFNYERPEVRSFLMSSACFWLDRYHADGLRVDAVASMLYQNDSQRPRQHSRSKENFAAIEFLRHLNTELYRAFPGVQTFAEESTAWPMVSRPTYVGGLGFGLKWDMGFTHDTLQYFRRDPVERKVRHNDLTFRGMYAFSENFVLPLSHDEGARASLLSRMPGDEAQRFAHLRLLLGYMFTQPGKKLLFMGDEFAQWREWNHDCSLDWHLLGQPLHAGVEKWITDLNKLYCGESALYETDTFSGGFEWVDCHDAEQSTLSWLRRNTAGTEEVVVLCNFTPVGWSNFRLAVPAGGHWEEIVNSDARYYGGAGQGNFGGVESAPFPWQGRPYTLTITLPPLTILAFKQRPTETRSSPGAGSKTRQIGLFGPSAP